MKLSNGLVQGFIGALVLGKTLLPTVAGAEENFLNEYSQYHKDWLISGGKSEQYYSEHYEMLYFQISKHGVNKRLGCGVMQSEDGVFLRNRIIDEVSEFKKSGEVIRVAFKTPQGVDVLYERMNDDESGPWINNKYYRIQIGDGGNDPAIQCKIGSGWELKDCKAIDNPGNKYQVDYEKSAEYAEDSCDALLAPLSQMGPRTQMNPLMKMSPMINEVSKLVSYFPFKESAIVDVRNYDNDWPVEFIRKESNRIYGNTAQQAAGLR